MLVDAQDAAARSFYESLGFQPFPSRPDQLFLLTSTATAAATLAFPDSSTGDPRP